MKLEEINCKIKNKIMIKGEICSHRTLLYKDKRICMIKTLRHSGTEDIIPLLLPAKDFSNLDLSYGKTYDLVGRVVTFPVCEKGRSLALGITCDDESKIALSNEPLTTETTLNRARFAGVLYKKSEFSITPFTNRQKVDGVLMVKGEEGEMTNFIPFVVWGKGAKAFYKSAREGAIVKLDGRFQSREFLRQIDEEQVNVRKEELSVNTFEILR